MSLVRSSAGKVDKGGMGKGGRGLARALEVGLAGLGWVDWVEWGSRYQSASCEIWVEFGFGDLVSMTGLGLIESLD